MTTTQLKQDLIHRIVPFIIVLAMFVLALIPFVKIVETGLKLAIISDNINYIEESAGYTSWTDSLKEDYQEQVSLRNKLCSSDNWLVRSLANGSSLFRFIVFAINSIILLFIGAFGVYIANTQIEIWKKRLGKQR